MLSCTPCITTPCPHPSAFLQASLPANADPVIQPDSHIQQRSLDSTTAAPHGPIHWRLGPTVTSNAGYESLFRRTMADVEKQLSSRTCVPFDEVPAETFADIEFDVELDARVCYTTESSSVARHRVNLSPRCWHSVPVIRWVKGC